VGKDARRPRRPRRVDGKRGFLNFTKNLALWVVIGLLLLALFNLFQGSTSRGPQADMGYSDFLDQVDQGKVANVTLQGQNIKWP